MKDKTKEQIETLNLILDMINEKNEFVAEKNGEVYYISLNNLKDNGKDFVFINTVDEKVVYFNNSEDIIDKIKNLDLDFKEQSKG